MQECRNYCMSATLGDYRSDTSLIKQLSPPNGNYLINTGWMLTAAVHIGKELSWLMAVCHSNGLSLSSRCTSVGHLALHCSFWPPIAFAPLLGDLLDGAKNVKVIAEREVSASSLHHSYASYCFCFRGTSVWWCLSECFNVMKKDSNCHFGTISSDGPGVSDIVQKLS